MIPISDDTHQRRRRFPAVMLALILANIVVFVYELALGPDLQSFITAFGAVPLEITTGRNLVPGSPSPIYLTLITSMFLHAGFLHIGGNMLFLWVFGDNVEDSLGHLGFLVFYLFCGVIAGLTQVLVDPTSQVPGIGASGAIAGVLAAYLVLYPRATVRTLVFLGIFFTFTRLSALFMIGAWIVIQVISGLVELAPNATSGSGVAFFAHIGGFFVGLLVIWVWKAVQGQRMPNS